MKLSAIVNNYGQKYDGVGNYAQVVLDNFPEEVEKKIYTSNCHTGNRKMMRILTLGMTRKILQAVWELRDQQCDIVLLEYPFTEFNPLALGAINVLGHVTKKKHIPFIVSLHEFERLNPLAKTIARFLCKHASAILVTTEQAKREISAFNSNVSIRKIPSIIYDKAALSEEIELDRNRYVFFGTVNKMKAVPELLEAWEQFNATEDKTLYLLTATQLDDEVKVRPGVKYIQGAEPAEIIQIMRSCAFCMVPIRPYVDEKNSSFFTGCLTGCISIGKMCDEYRKLSFTEHVADYDSDSLIQVLNRTSQMSDEEIRQKCNAAYEFGRDFSPEQVSKELYTFLNVEISRAY